jgi:hypothetical protein
MADDDIVRLGSCCCVSVHFRRGRSHSWDVDSSQDQARHDLRYCRRWGVLLHIAMEIRSASDLAVARHRYAKHLDV